MNNQQYVHGIGLKAIDDLRERVRELEAQLAAAREDLMLGESGRVAIDAARGAK